MTGHQINSLVGDLVAMAQAMERLPQVEAECRMRDETITAMRKNLEELDADLEQARSYAASLEQKVRDAEVAKDQAETMFLEADERTSRALDFIKATFGNAGSLIQALEPVKEVPVPLEHTLSSGHMEAGSSGQSMAGSTALNEISHFEAGVQGQSEAPLPDVPLTTDHSAPLPVPSADAAHGSNDSWAGPASTDTPPAPKPPFSGVNYIDVKGWHSREDWLAGGGTNESYDFRY